MVASNHPLPHSLSLSLSTAPPLSLHLLSCEPPLYPYRALIIRLLLLLPISFSSPPPPSSLLMMMLLLQLFLILGQKNHVAYLERERNGDGIRFYSGKLSNPLNCYWVLKDWPPWSHPDIKKTWILMESYFFCPTISSILNYSRDCLLLVRVPIAILTYTTKIDNIVTKEWRLGT